MTIMIKQRNTMLVKVGKLTTKFFKEKYSDLHEIILTDNEPAIINKISYHSPIIVKVFIKKKGRVNIPEISGFIQNYFQIKPDKIRLSMVETAMCL